MTDETDEAFRVLQVEYLDSMVARLAELRSDIVRLQHGPREAAASLAVRLHRLAGSAGSYRFPELSSLAREAERWTAQFPGGSDVAPLEQIVDRMAEFVARAVREEAAKRGSGEAGK